MLTINSNEEAEKLIINGMLVIDDDMEIACDDLIVKADIKCKNIYSKGYRRNLNCYNIDCHNLNCHNIDCCDIDCDNLNCYNLNCYNIDCVNIDCHNIDCCDLSYYAVCFAYRDIVCNSIKGRRKNARHFCLDGEITIRPKKDKTEMTVAEIEKKLGVPVGSLRIKKDI